jgi:hypothetical protein
MPGPMHSAGLRPGDAHDAATSILLKSVTLAN